MGRSIEMHHKGLASCALAAIVCLALASTACFALQNIRIQVNNENLQNPPYLLEALKQASALDSNNAAQPSQESPQQTAPMVASGTPVNQPSRLQATEPTTAQNLGRRGMPGSGIPSQREPMTSAVVKGETIEELLDLAPESVLRLSPESIISSVQSNDQEDKSSVEPTIEHMEQPQASSLHETIAHRKPQLPVTSSHLKRPALSADQLSEGAVISSSMSVSETSTGAKSRVSPSVLADGEPPASAAVVNLDKKPGPHPPDTWEPSQVMQGVTNASLVPATVRRQYGHQTRTRITLGGGYTRNKLPPLADPSSSDYHEDRQERPLAPLERPPSVSATLDEGSNLDSAVGDHEQGGGGGPAESSRLVEVPKRIVLPSNAFSLNDGEQSASLIASSGSVTKRPNNIQNSTATRRRDSRCPANGVTSLEHPSACDKYFLCQNGQLSEQTCPNGLLYGTRDVVRDFCVHRWEAVCGDKSIPNPISSPGCRWQNGIFNVQGSPKCVPDFYECKDGQFEVRKCSVGGQVYDDKTKSCRYAELVGCTQEALADFRCPADDQTNTYWPFPRYFLNERALIHCVNDKPEIIRCRDHERVDTENLFCVPINKSPEGADESAGAPEMTARRSNNNGGVQQREKAAAKPVAASQGPAAAATVVAASS